MNKQNSFIAIIIIVSVAATIFFVYRYFGALKILEEADAKLQVQTVNGKVLDFGKIFVQKVLKAEKEIGFEERLLLESTVRGLGNDEILKKWKEFIDSKTEVEAQKAVKDLLEAIFANIKFR